MKHMDEGRLQAWLDGDRAGLSDAERLEIEAHLLECPECSAHLDALRGSDHAVEALLAAGADADVDVPDFGAIVARSKDLGAGDAARRPRRLPLSWAASVVVALGVGWMANEMIRSNPSAVTSGVTPADASRSTVETLESRRQAPAGELRSVDDAAQTSTVGTDVDAGTDPAVPPSNEAPTAAEAAGPRTDGSGTGPAASGARPEEAGPPPTADLVGADTLARAAASALGRDAVDRTAPSRSAFAPTPSPAAPPESFTPRRASTSERTIRGRVVASGSGRGLESAQVFFPGTNSGALTDRDGRFQLHVDAPTYLGGADLMVELIGYSAATVPVDLEESTVNLDDVPLEATALRLQELAVTGVADEEPRVRTQVAADSGDAEDRATEVPAPATAALLRSVPAEAAGFDARMLPGATVLSIEIVRREPASVLRIDYRLDSDVEFTLYQSPEPFIPEEVGTSEIVVTRVDGDLYLAGVAALSPSAIREVLDRLR